MTNLPSQNPKSNPLSHIDFDKWKHGIKTSSGLILAPEDLYLRSGRDLFEFYELLDLSEFLPKGWYIAPSTKEWSEIFTEYAIDNHGRVSVSRIVGLLRLHRHVSSCGRLSDSFTDYLANPLGTSFLETEGNRGAMTTKFIENPSEYSAYDGDRSWWTRTPNAFPLTIRDLDSREIKRAAKQYEYSKKYGIDPPVEMMTVHFHPRCVNSVRKEPNAYFGTMLDAFSWENTDCLLPTRCIYNPKEAE